MAALLIAQVPGGPISRELVSLIIGYVVLGVVVSAFYYLSRNAWLKRKLLAPFNIVIGVYFGCILYVGGAAAGLLLVFSNVDRLHNLELPIDALLRRLRTHALPAEHSHARDVLFPLRAELQ